MIEFRETAFMGKITAGVTHEMKNVLAIIRESAGLMEDLLSLSGNTSFKHQEKFSQVLLKIEGQVSRGVALSSALNKFAHSSDLTSSEVDLDEVIPEIVFLSQRFAHVKGITLRFVPQHSSMKVVIDPLKFQMVVFGCIELIMDVLDSGSELCIRPSEYNGAEVSMEFYSDRLKSESYPMPASAPQWPSLLRAAQDLGANIEPAEPPSWFRLVMDKNR